MNISTDNSFSRKATLALLPLALLAGSLSFAACGNRHGASSDETDDADSIPGVVTRIAKAISNGDAEVVASMTQYPIERPYPLRSIEDSAAMVEYFPIMVDDSLRVVAASAANGTEDWNSMGWRGYTIHDGEYMWIADGLYSVNYLSKPEKALRKILARQEIESLAPELRKGWTPSFCLIDSEDGTLYRVDMATDTITSEEPQGMEYPDNSTAGVVRTYRLMVYPRTYDLSGNPSLQMTGHMETEGTAQVRTYYFSGPAGAEAEYTYDRMTDEAPVIIFRRPGGKGENHRVKPAYWRDYISRPR